MRNSHLFNYIKIKSICIKPKELQLVTSKTDGEIYKLSKTSFICNYQHIRLFHIRQRINVKKIAIGYLYQKV